MLTLQNLKDWKLTGAHVILTLHTLKMCYIFTLTCITHDLERGFLNSLGPFGSKLLQSSYQLREL